MAYVSRSEVMMEAGQLNIELGQALSGTVDGANTIFTTDHFPIVDRTFNDTVEAADIVVYDDGVAVSVSSITEGSGTITLSSAPVASSVMTVDYAHHRVDNAFLDLLIAQTQDWIDTVMTTVETVPYDDLPNTDSTIRKIARYYAAGMMISQGYGLHSPSNDDLREGQAKIEMAEKWLMDYKEQVTKNQDISSGVDAPQVSEDKRLFEEYDSATGWKPLDDADVMLNDTTP